MNTGPPGIAWPSPRLHETANDRARRLEMGRMPPHARDPGHEPRASTEGSQVDTAQIPQAHHFHDEVLVPADRGRPQPRSHLLSRGILENLLGAINESPTHDGPRQSSTAHHGLRRPKRVHTSPQDCPRGPQEAPKTAQGGPETAQEVSLFFQRSEPHTPRDVKT